MTGVLEAMNEPYAMEAASLFVSEFSIAKSSANTEPMWRHINVGSGGDISILDLAHKIAEVPGYLGRIVTDPTKPDGTSRKLMDSIRLGQMGWSAQIGLDQGLSEIYE